MDKLAPTFLKRANSTTTKFPAVRFEVRPTMGFPQPVLVRSRERARKRRVKKSASIKIKAPAAGSAAGAED
jgi:hypothetical protein